ncbi:MAG: class I SAM-dependent methyltransferase [Chthoniobacterales bacterium]
MLLAPFWMIPKTILKYKGYGIDAIIAGYESITGAKFSYISNTYFKKCDLFTEFPEVINQDVRLSKTHWNSSHDRAEYPLLMAICASLQPKRIFEFGTFLGEATRMFAIASPLSKIVTLNIAENVEPVLQLNEKEKIDLISNDKIGVYFKNTPEEFRITQILDDSFNFSTIGYEGKFDLIWIDAGHSYECVKNDSHKAFQMISSGGYIFWHDFDSSQPELVKALLEISKYKKISWIPRTSIALFHNLD